MLNEKVEDGTIVYDEDGAEYQVREGRIDDMVIVSKVIFNNPEVVHGRCLGEYEIKGRETLFSGAPVAKYRLNIIYGNVEFRRFSEESYHRDTVIHYWNGTKEKIPDGPTSDVNKRIDAAIERQNETAKDSLKKTIKDAEEQLANLK